MAHHGPSHLTDADTRTPGGGAWPVYRNLFLLGLLGLGVAFALALILELSGSHGWQRFAFDYLVGYAFWLAAGLGCLFFVIITHLFRAGWCVMVRRVAENGAAALPTLAVLFLPILLFIWANNGWLYSWADAKWDQMAAAHAAGAGPEHTSPEEGEQAEPHGHTAADGLLFVAAEADHEHEPEAADAGEHMGITDHQDHVLDTAHDARVAGAPSEAMQFEFLFREDGTRTNKGTWLTRPLFTLRWVVYFAVWCIIGLYFRKLSVKQDQTKDPALTNKREFWAPLSVLLFAITITFAAFDLIMSLDPTWYSTIFGVYYFASAMTCGLCTLILSHMWMQKKGLVPSVTVEHFHDLGKLLFAFVFFWGYIAYSQYVLIWYPSLPEIAYWFQLRGATTVSSAPQYGSLWSWLVLLLLFGHLFVPFAFLLSRHVKRNRACLQGAALWMLFMVLVDMIWLIRPVLSAGQTSAGPIGLNLVEVIMFAAAFVGIGGITIGAGVKAAAGVSLVAHGDPRLHESLRLDTSAAAPMPDLH